MFRVSALFRFVAAVALASATVALAFKISPLPEVHETLTSEALECSNASDAGLPTRCITSPALALARGRDVSASYSMARPDGGVARFPADFLRSAVRWPDDPTDKAASSTLANMVAMFVSECRSYRGGVNSGLFCSSHYGPLQFFHAMASSPGETRDQTRTRMIEWTTFLAEVARGDIALEQNYCEFFLKNAARFPNISPVLSPPDFLGCKAKRPWTLRTLFSLHCNSIWNIFSSKSCTETFDSDAARLKAVGALLHLVQDSYAEGHAQRGGCPVLKKGVSPIVACLPIQRFHDYSQQSSDKHGMADLPPVVGESCYAADARVDDPVLASAKVLWHLRHGSPAAEVVRVVDGRVLAMIEPAPPLPDGGSCFGR